ncbi:LuxR family transcriptional regulator [Chitinophaga oryzae]|uniref:LuxR family transcriptional regulator n=1 Tax=Chitinophaga oryzae TaxID=2725414 RepID=A0AAE6ZG28_9BACT|nr:LuxR C-terminal-related transcriptional regulator [Chitinophaga oryzae]QJB32143.1 LuxR family transcriptional regulator [Chitinophaga oryzae]QJB38619.1 LuxR family transcriptional regulator [Chitinophaga oryzae]
MRIRHWFIILYLTGCLLPAKESAGQRLLIDSLRHELTKDSRPESRIMTTARLARALFYKDIREAIQLEQQALMVAAPLEDGRYKAFTFATLAYLYPEVKDYAAMHAAIDSAVWYAARTQDKVTKGFVYLRKGILAFSAEKYDEAMSSLLESLRYLEGQEAWHYENLAYYYIAGTYWANHDRDNYNRYARLSWQTALKSKNPDDICRAYQSLGSTFLERYRTDSSQRNLLDSALYYNGLSIGVAGQQKDWLVFRNTAAVAALNNGDIYFEFYPAAYRDSAEKYIYLALNIAREVRYPEVVANSYGLLSEYAIREGRYDEAEKILLLGLARAEEDSTTADFTKARLFTALAGIAEKSGNPAKALRYYKDYVRYDKAYFDAGKLNSIRKLEAQYQSDKKEQALAAMEERAAFNRKLNFFYACLIVASLLALIFLFRSYHFRLKASMRQQQLLTKEKEDAALQAGLQARLQQEEAARLLAEQQLMQERQDRLEKELLAGTLRSQEKSGLLLTLRDKLSNESGNVLKQMDRIIHEDKRLDEDFEMVKSDFTEIRPEFVARLQQHAQNTLTRLDLKYCAYILMGLSGKEIAARLHVAPKSIRMARYRLKQKLGLQKEDNLDGFIRGLA